MHDKPGKAGKVIKDIGENWFLYMDKSTPQAVAFHEIPQQKIENPFRDYQHGGTMFGWKGNNYWVSDRCFIGFFLKILYK